MQKHILIVDDEPQIRYSTGLVLKTAGYKISEADNGLDALSIILDAYQRNERIDLLLVDISMPQMSGVELIDELNKSEISIPMFAISGSGDRALIAELRRRGCTEFLSKPFGPKDIVRRIEAIFSQSNGSESERM